MKENYSISCKTAALQYLTKGYSVIPINPKTKKPFIAWKKFQEKYPTQEEIRKWWTQWPSANVAIITGKISGICAIDIDEPKGFDAIQDYIPDSLLIPTSKTPKGGQHLYFKMPEKSIGNNSRVIPGCDFRGEGGYIIAPPSKEYNWHDGLSIDMVEPPSLPSKYLLFINAFNLNIGEGKKPNDFKRLQLTSTDFKKISEGQRDEMLFHIANSIINHSMQVEEIQSLLGFLALYCCEPPFPLKEIPAKIKSVLNRIERRERNIAEEVREWVLTSNDFWLTSDCFKRLQLTSRSEQKAAELEILRLFDKGFIEKNGNKRGCYRTVDNTCEEIDFLHAPTHTVEIAFPFEIEKKVELMPGNVVVIAGEANAGKTAFLLNVIKDNMNHFDIHYFSSEMGSSELRKRLSKFDMPLKDWRFKAKERSDNFADVIVEGEGRINIIDFLEIYENFYLVASRINEIYKKLNGAIAIIALQKNPQTDTGRGGQFSLEKPRLYLAMSKGKLIIVKAKNWKDKINPNGQEINFNLIDGCKLIKKGDWHLGREK